MKQDCVLPLSADPSFIPGDRQAMELFPGLSPEWVAAVARRVIAHEARKAAEAAERRQRIDDEK